MCSTFSVKVLFRSKLLIFKADLNTFYVKYVQTKTKIKTSLSTTSFVRKKDQRDVSRKVLISLDEKNKTAEGLHVKISNTYLILFYFAFNFSIMYFILCFLLFSSTKFLILFRIFTWTWVVKHEWEGYLSRHWGPHYEAARASYRGRG